MGKGKHKSNEEIIELLKKYEDTTDLRASDMALYQLARRKGLLKDMKTKNISRKDPQRIIDWIKSFETRTELRNANNPLYTWCLRNGFDIHFPPKINVNRLKGKKEKPPKADNKKIYWDPIEKQIDLMPQDQYLQLEKFLMSIKFQNWRATDGDVMLLQLFYYIHFDPKPQGKPEDMYNKQFFRLAKLYKIERDKRLKSPQY